MGWGQLAPVDCREALSWRQLGQATLLNFNAGIWYNNTKVDIKGKQQNAKIKSSIKNKMTIQTDLQDPVRARAQNVRPEPITPDIIREEIRTFLSESLNKGTVTIDRARKIAEAVSEELKAEPDCKELESLLERLSEKFGELNAITESKQGSASRDVETEICGYLLAMIKNGNFDGAAELGEEAVESADKAAVLKKIKALQSGVERNWAQGKNDCLNSV